MVPKTEHRHGILFYRKWSCLLKLRSHVPIGRPCLGVHLSMTERVWYCFGCFRESGAVDPYNKPYIIHVYTPIMVPTFTPPLPLTVSTSGYLGHQEKTAFESIQSSTGSEHPQQHGSFAVKSSKSHYFLVWAYKNLALGDLRR